ncbi:unnamed protein product [Albugo candida]|uniref:Uncharacterized protein n=1 Tax=Albugo candida TaxID=65357 RepID=A0A024GJ39_9STRA|nr:unnamed protein product [Albugo candida]|eukprot:CCI46726.1 unnamed protein product [Albugo candida]
MFIFIIESRSEQVVIAPRSSISSQITHLKLSLRVQMQLYFRPYLKAEQFLDYVIFSVIEPRTKAHNLQFLRCFDFHMIWSCTVYNSFIRLSTYDDVSRPTLVLVLLCLSNWKLVVCIPNLQMLYSGCNYDIYYAYINDMFTSHCWKWWPLCSNQVQLDRY